MNDRKIPVLTDIVERRTPSQTVATLPMAADELAELQARIATRSYALIERLLQESLREMEANLFADVIGRLRTELPDLIEEELHQHFDDARRSGPEPG